MKPALILFCLIFLFAGCKDEKPDQLLICSEQYVTITIKVRDIQNAPVALESFKVTRTADQSDVTIKVDPADYAIMQKQGIYPIANDSSKRQLDNKNVEVVFTGMVGGKVVVNQKYTIGTDKCHVLLVSGEREVIVQ